MLFSFDADEISMCFSRQAKENYPNNNSNEKRKRDGIAGGFEDLHDQFAAESKRGKTKRHAHGHKNFFFFLSLSLELIRLREWM